MLAGGASVSAAPAPFAPPGENERIVYRDVILVDPDGGAPQRNMAVITRGERIDAILPLGALDPERIEGARTVEGGGLYLIPGLVDAHQHFATPPDAEEAKASLRRAVHSGVTAVRIMADDLRSIAELARAARAGEIEAPDLYFAALVAGPSFFEDPRTRAAAADQAPGTAPWMQAVDSGTDLPLAVARARGTGAHALKIYANLPPEMVRHVTEEGKRQGMEIWAHSMIFPTRPADVLAANPDTVSHICYLAYQISDRPPGSYQERSAIDPAPFLGDRTHPAMAALFAAMRERGIVLDPTLWVYRALDRNAAARGQTSHCPLELAAHLTAQAHRAGVRLAAGTDGETPAEEAWPAVHEEMSLLVERAGLSAAEALRAGTVNGAAAAGQDADMGRIAPGRLANFVLLDRNPAESIAHLRTIRFTVKRGRLFPRADFSPPPAAEGDGDE